MATAVVATLVDHGVRHVVIAPGSRSAPLALACATHPGLRVHVHLDERSAAFFALGIGKALGRPAAVVTTSGTAAANLHPAVLEAFHSRVPLVVLTADRPQELRDTGAGQTIDQVRLFGTAVRWFFDMSAGDGQEAVARMWGSVAARAVTIASGVDGPAGPVHLNISFADPLIPPWPLPPGADWPPARWSADQRRNGAAATTGEGTAATVRRARAQLWRAGEGDLDLALSLIRGARRGVLLAGWDPAPDRVGVARLAQLTGWPLLADPLSGARHGPQAIASYDVLLSAPKFAEAHRPDVLVACGAPPTSKRLAQWREAACASGARLVLLDPDGAWLDPSHSADVRLVMAPSTLAAALAAVSPHRAGAAQWPLGAPALLDPPLPGSALLESPLPGSPLPGSPLPDTPLPQHNANQAAWLAQWQDADTRVSAALHASLDECIAPFEGRLARDLVACLPQDAVLLVGSSMPVRDVETFSRPRGDLRILSNRGVNGIDGFVSTALGLAAARCGPVVAYCGDLTALHDVGGLLRAARSEDPIILVIADNSGGGIFSFLPQAALPGPLFEQLFGTPQGHDLAALAEAVGLRVTHVTKARALAPTLDDVLQHAASDGRSAVVLASTQREENVRLHREVLLAARAGLSS